MAVYGPAGSGKTTLAASAEDSEQWGRPVLLVDAEGGASAVADRKTVQVMDVTDWKTIESFTQTAIRMGDQFPYKTVVFDNLSEIVNMLVQHVTGDNETPSQPEWGKVTLAFLKFIRDWRELSRRGTVNVIYIAWEEEVRDEVGRAKYNLAFTPRIRRDFPGIIDIIAYLSVNEKSKDKYERTLDFAPSPRTVSKFRRAPTDAALSIPYQITYDLDHLPMGDLLAVLRGGEQWPSNKYAAKSANK